MAGCIDFYDLYLSGSMQALTGFYIFTGFLKQRVKPIVCLLFAVSWSLASSLLGADNSTEFVLYALLLVMSGIFLGHADRIAIIFYASLAIEIMHLGYGIVDSLLMLSYPLLLSFGHKTVGIIFLILGDVMALTGAVFCYWLIKRSFFCDQTLKKQYVFVALTPILLLFLMGEYMQAVLGANSGPDLTNGSGTFRYPAGYQILVIQLLAMASLFCTLFAYQKLLENFRLSTELSLLEQEEYSLNRYVEEARVRYEKTKSFRHDIQNHMTVVKKLLQRGNARAALDYIGDMKEMADELSFPCSTNNPAVDILMGNKLRVAADMGIQVDCSLLLPCPCPVRDIDFCIILANALDNAIHACEKMDDTAEKYIRVTGDMQGDFLLLEIENSFQGEGIAKKGTGLSNIKMVAEKYQGAMNSRTQGTVFFLSVLLIIPQH